MVVRRLDAFHDHEGPQVHGHLREPFAEAREFAIAASSPRFQHTGIVWRVAFSADGKLLASGSNDKTIRLWDVQSHEPLKVIPVGSNVFCVAFSPDGKRLAAACRDGSIRLYDVARRQQVAELRGHTDYVHSIAWSPDGTRLVSGSGDFTVRIWDSLSAQDRAKRTAAK
jgi:WD40 repeat protein